MTDERREPNQYENYIRLEDRIQEFGKLTKSASPRESRSELRDAAQRTLKERAYNYGVERGRIDSAVVTDASSMGKKQEQLELKTEQLELQEEAGNALYNNLGVILEQSPGEKLERLVTDKKFLGVSKPEERALFMAYQAVKGEEEFLRAYEETGAISNNKDANRIIEAAAKGARKAQIERLRDSGLSNDYKELAADAAENAVREGYLGAISSEAIKNYALAGLREQVAKIKSEFEGKYGTNVNVANKVRVVISRLGRDRDSDMFDLAREMVYSTKE